MPPIRDATVSFVLERFGLSVYGLTALGNCGGFSGAKLWRVTTQDGEWCLKAWPPALGMAWWLNDIHRHMRQAKDAGLAFVPGLRNTTDESSCVEAAGRCWDLTTWLTGRADFRDLPTTSRIAAACEALAQLHRAWRP